ncbi:MAG: sensor histidine kinase [Candidatus Omnitrophica bacterium]|nr:sensor histidine kinase [Candidatus Omnitrophota bacterium]
MLKKLKLRPKFFLSLIIISIVPLVIISLFNYLYTKSEIKERTVGNLRALNDSRVAHINQFIRLRQEQAKALAGTFTIRQLDPQGANSPRTVQMVQADIESVYSEIKKTPRSDYRDIDLASSIANISVWDIHGNIIANTNRFLVGKKMPFKFLHILYSKGTYFMGFEKDSLTDEKFLTILEGVRNWESGEYSGVVFLRSDANVLDEITAARKGLGRTGETYIVNKSRLMITESRFVKDAILNLEVNTRAVDACFDSDKTKSPEIYKNYRGDMVLGVQRYLPDQQWCVITETATEEAFDPVTAFRNRILVIGGCLILLILFLVHVAGLAFVRPILQIRDASLKVARGNYDVTTKVDSEDELHDLSRSFNQMTKVLASTTAQLHEKNKILEQQKEELKKLNELKSEFVSMVSHELRTPMSIIRGSLSQLADETVVNTKEISQRLINISLNNIKRLTEMINNLLDLSKIEAGKIELHKEDIDIVGVLKEICQTFELKAKDHQIQMRYRSSSESIIVNVDRDKIIQIFFNLTGNSMKFVEKGFIEVSAEDKGDHILCMVEDSGPGISKESLDKVFSKFQQLGHKAINDPGTKGTGLGLSISKGLVELHGGTIWLESEIGVGTKFIFTLPKQNVDSGDSQE